ncbi:MAG TPA: hypothetical protein VIG54_10685 [Lysobacter sp.]
MLLIGVAGWGLPMFVFMTLLRPWIGGRMEQVTMRHLAVGALVWALAGVAFGLFMWHVGNTAPRSRQNNERTTQ